MKDFNVNEYNVFDKPEDVVVVDHKNFKFTVHLAYYKGFWFSSTDIREGYSGACSLPGPDDHKKYKTRCEAILKTVEEVKRDFEPRVPGPMDKRSPKSVQEDMTRRVFIINRINEFLDSLNEQTSLFG